ncbi:MAG: FtsX-like permease family protein [Phycisphaeraceae bacterium]|nr:FtsX-like permease family protein [Phycisphaeraceae bacterium]
MPPIRTPFILAAGLLLATLLSARVSAGPVAEDRFSGMDAVRRQAISDLNTLHPDALRHVEQLSDKQEIRRVIDAVLQQPYIVDESGKRRFLLGDERDLTVEGGIRGQIGYEINAQGRGVFYFRQRQADGTHRRGDGSTVRTLSDSLSVGARRAELLDPETERGGLHQWLWGVLGSESGRFADLEYVGSLRGQVMAPVELSNLREPGPRTEPSTLTVGDGQWSLSPLWPNGVMTSLTPEGGVSGPLVYVGEGDWADLNGLQLRGAIAVMDFAGGRNFEALFGLGVRAVVVIEGPPDSPRDQITRERAETLFANTPIPAPRFFLSTREIRRVAENGGPDLYRMLGLRDREADGPAQPMDAVVAGGHIYENRPYEAMYFYLPPTEPLVITISEDELLRRVAAEFGTEPRRIIDDNPNVDFANLTEGTELLITSRRTTYRVREDDLARRLVSQYGLPNVASLRRANDLADGQSIPSGRLTIPNLDDSVMLTVSIDSVSVAPDHAHGATTATNIAAAIRLLEFLTREGTAAAESVRRKGLVIALLDAEYLGGYSSRLFAENVLLRENRLVGIGEGDKPFPVFGLIMGILIAGGIGWLIGYVLAGGEPDNPKPFSRRWLPGTITAVLFGAFGATVVVIAHNREGLLGDVLPPETRLAYYTELKEWAENPAPTGLSADAAEWFVQDWLTRRVEAARADKADEAAAVGRRQAAFRRGTDEFSQLEREIRAAEAITLDIAEMRDSTLMNRSLPWTERAYRFWRLVEQRDREGTLPDPSLRTELLRERLLQEYQEERTERDYVLANRDVIDGIIEVIHPSAQRDRAEGDRAVVGSPLMGWMLSLSDGGPSAGLVLETQAPFRVRPPVASNATYINSINARMREVMTVATVRGRWERDWLFLTEADAVDHPFQMPRVPVHYTDFWASVNVGLLPLVTMNEQKVKLDTPRDVPERLAADHLAPQFKTAITLIALGLESHLDSSSPDRFPRIDYGRLSGRILEFNARSGIDAQDPVPDVLVYSPNLPRTAAGGRQINSSTLYGGRMGFVAQSRRNGNYQFPVESLTFMRDSTPRVYAYGMDIGQGLVNRVANEAQIGTQQQTFNFSLVADRVTEKNLIVTEVYPWVFAPGPDPVDYRSVASPGQELVITDAVTGGQPEHFGIDNPLLRYLEIGTESNILYMQPGRRARIVAQRGTGFPMLLTGPIPGVAEGTEEARFRAARRGVGYIIGQTADGDPNIFLEMTPLKIARDMNELARQRQGQYASRNLRDQSVDDALVRADELLARAEQAAKEGQWQAAYGQARVSWGMLQRAYPRILQLGREAIFSAVILMGILVPGCWFLERLVVGSKTIIRKLIGTTILFALVVVFLQFTHPALLIAVSPFIVIVAFVMILMSIVVLGICYQRFDVLVRRARASAGEVESEEISFFASLATALSLGVSNLKKRPSRTFLTSLTVTVLTFSIITFVSVSGRDALMQSHVSLEDRIEGRTVEPLEPKFEGVVFREYNWRDLGRDFVSAIKSEFGDEHEVAIRGFWIEVAGGNNADREGRNMIQVRRMPDRHRVRSGQTVEQIAELRRAEAGAIRIANGLGPEEQPEADDVLTIPRVGPPFIATGIMGFEPQEVRFSHLHQTISNQHWFAEDDPYPFQIMLPDNAAAELGIAAEDIFDGTPEQIAAGEASLRPEDELPRVFMRNMPWRVVGIMDTDEADRYRDLTGRSLAMVDFLMSAFTPAASGDLINEGPSLSYSWQRLVTVPMLAADRVGVTPKSLAIRFEPDRHNIEQIRRDIELRINYAMFGTFDNRLSLITTRTQSSVAGLAQVIVPVLLCILIVLNTMMGAVDERKGEVSMLGAIGLSPNQISFLLLSESMVFSVLGIIFGTLAGLAFAWAIPAANAFFNIEVLTELSFNFTSVIAMLLAMATGMVVLVATLVPARKAAALAAPSGMAKWDLPEPVETGRIVFSLPFTLTRGNAVGMMAFFRRFLLNHSEATSTDFNCRDVAVDMLAGAEDALRVKCDMWLAPYDLDVSQHVQMNVHPTPNEGVFGVTIDLRRASGTEESWSRTNYGFLNLVRQQFLLWRNLDDASRSRFIHEGAAIFKEASK